jgi:lipoprotein-anchoring transpeptidase ErfK/SrfK
MDFIMKKIISFSITLLASLFLSGCAGTMSMSSANFPATRTATGGHVFIYDPKQHAWAAYDGSGHLVRTGRASGGKPYCPEIGRPCRTVVGRYSILAKGDSSCESSKYPIKTGGGAPMPYCMKFHAKGYAIHGTSYVPSGYNSHGCIGVSVGDAEWLSGFLPVGSTVVVRSY